MSCDLICHTLFTHYSLRDPRHFLQANMHYSKPWAVTMSELVFQTNHSEQRSQIPQTCSSLTYSTTAVELYSVFECSLVSLLLVLAWQWKQLQTSTKWVESQGQRLYINVSSTSSCCLGAQSVMDPTTLADINTSIDTIISLTLFQCLAESS